MPSIHITRVTTLKLDSLLDWNISQQNSKNNSTYGEAIKKKALWKTASQPPSLKFQVEFGKKHKDG